MRTMISKFLALFILFILFSCSPDHFIISTKLAAPVITIPLSPGEGYIWIDGEWFWNGRSYTWRDGYWTRPMNGYRYNPGQWKQRRDGWYWRPGHWNRR